MRHIDATISQMDIFDYTPNSLPSAKESYARMLTASRDWGYYPGPKVQNPPIPKGFRVSLHFPAYPGLLVQARLVGHYDSDGDQIGLRQFDPSA